MNNFKKFYEPCKIDVIPVISDVILGSDMLNNDGSFDGKEELLGGRNCTFLSKKETYGKRDKDRSRKQRRKKHTSFC